MKLSISIDWRIFAPALIIIAGVCWGLIGLFSNYLSAAGLRPEQITVIRCVLACFVIGGYLLIFKRGAFKVRVKHLWIFLGTGVLSIAFYNVC